ncbi:MAG TPA: efflux RND transporter periplasmic adaptor subunit [Longimicrobiales bacterium]|nr:efflux RND transporter periplasmic adaptor subunit [Longimicrobiales bacterium]
MNGSMRPVKGLALMLLLLTAACGGDSAGETPQAQAEPEAVVLQPTDVAVVQPTRITGGIVLTGTLNPEMIVEVRTQVPGIVGRLAVDRGDPIRRGQLIAVIEAEGIRSAAAGALAQVSAAEANLALARQQLQSSRTLYERGAISQIALQTAEAAYQAAEGQLAAARAQASSASESARRANITSPIAGEVSGRHVSQGEAVSPGDALITVVNTAELELAGQVPVQSAARVERGQRVEFTVDAYPGQTFEGVVARVEPTADPATRQVGVYLRLPNPGGRIVGGVFATGRVLSEVSDSVLAVPTGAVRTEDGGTYVWVIEQERLTRRPVVTGIRDDRTGLVEIVSGLSAGDRVLTSPGAVEEGMLVRFANAGGPASPAETER